MLLAAALVAVGTIFLAFKFGGPKSQVASEKSSDTLELVSFLQNSGSTDKDADKDGLTDWEETLWKLDPDNPYSNGNKNPDDSPITDGDYAKSQAGNYARTSANGVAGIENVGLTQTGKLGQDIFDRYLVLKQQGLPIDNTVKEKLIQDAISNNPYPKGKTYAISDIKIGGAETISTLRAYGNTIGNSILKNSPQRTQQGDAALVFRDAFQAKDLEKIKNLDPIIQAYQGILRDLIQVTVVKSVSEKHLALINSISAMVYDVESMRIIFDDPVRGLNGAKSYAKTSFDFYWNIKSLAEYFKARGVVFGKNDDGYAFQVIVQ